jgi:hypothetical protein
MLKNLFKHPGFHSLVFGVFLILWNWPILTIPEQHHDQSLYNFLFFVWGLLILLLILIGINVRGDDSEQAGD